MNLLKLNNWWFLWEMTMRITLNFNLSYLLTRLAKILLWVMTMFLKTFHYFQNMRLTSKREEMKQMILKCSQLKKLQGNDWPSFISKSKLRLSLKRLTENQFDLFINLNHSNSKQTFFYRTTLHSRTIKIAFNLSLSTPNPFLAAPLFPLKLTMKR